MNDSWQSKLHDPIFYSTSQKDPAKLATVLDGVSTTKKMTDWTKEIEFDAIFYPYKPEFIAVNASNYYSKEAYKLTFTDHSGWFLPSIGQWFLAYQACGVKFNNGDFSDKAAAVTALNKMFTDAGLGDYKLATNVDYFSTTQLDYTAVWTIGQKEGVHANLMYEKDDKKEAVNHGARCFVAFTIKY